MSANPKPALMQTPLAAPAIVRPPRNPQAPQATRTYRETFTDGPSGWWGFINNTQGHKPLEHGEGCVVSRSPWWVDYNHAPPGAGYLNMVFSLNTVGPQTEKDHEVAGMNRFVAEGHPLDFTDAEIMIRVKGELLPRGSQFVLLVQGNHGGIISGWALTGQPFTVTSEWCEQRVTLEPDPSQWTCLGSRHDRTDMYGRLPLETVLHRVNNNIMLINFPLNVQPMGPINGDPHLLRAGKDYPLWQHCLPEGYVMLDKVEIRFAPEQEEDAAMSGRKALAIT